MWVVGGRVCLCVCRRVQGEEALLVITPSSPLHLCGLGVKPHQCSVTFKKSGFRAPCDDQKRRFSAHVLPKTSKTSIFRVRETINCFWTPIPPISNVSFVFDVFDVCEVETGWKSYYILSWYFVCSFQIWLFGYREVTLYALLNGDVIHDVFDAVYNVSLQ